jgi:orotate phosphoribosyltransferase-like protein
MSAIKRIIESVLELYSNGIPLAQIAERLRVPIDTVEKVVEEHSNFYDY